MEQSLWAFVLYGMVKVWTLKSKWDSSDLWIWSFEPSPFESQPKRHSFDKDTLVDDLWLWLGMKVKSWIQMDRNMTRKSISAIISTNHQSFSFWDALWRCQTKLNHLAKLNVRLIGTLFFMRYRNTIDSLIDSLKILFFLNEKERDREPLV